MASLGLVDRTVKSKAVAPPRIVELTVKSVGMPTHDGLFAMLKCWSLQLPGFGTKIEKLLGDERDATRHRCSFTKD